MAPSITTPALTYFQSATSSFRASATIVVLRRRPPLRFDSVLEPEGECRAVAADGVAKGWQASWIIVVRSRGLPDCEMPCSRLTDPLCQGVGARPA